VQGRRRDPLALRHSAATFWVVALVVLALDQVVKIAVRASMFEGQSIPVFDGIFHLTFVRNVGAAFGLLPGYQPIFIVTSCVVLIAIAAYWRRARPTAWPIVVALALITGGAVGNLIDRMFLGRVTDIFDFTLIDFPVFNIADTAIVVGVGILIGWLIFVPEPEHGRVSVGELESDSDAEIAAPYEAAGAAPGVSGESATDASTEREVDWL